MLRQITRSLVAFALMVPTMLAGAITDDSYEHNDSFNAARAIGPGTIPNLVLLDADWFKVDVPTSGQLAARIEFANAQGDLELEIYYAAPPAVPIAGSYSVNDFEQLTVTNNTGVTQTYRIKVRGFAGATNPNYTLKVSVLVAAPAPDFVATPTYGPAPLSVQFLDASSGAVDSYYWEFGDSQTSTVQNPVNVYLHPGNYSVTLHVTGPGGTNSLTKPLYISVLPPGGDLEPNNSPATASPLFFYPTVGSIDTPGDVDYYKIRTVYEPDCLHSVLARVFAFCDTSLSTASQDSEMRITTKQDTLEFDDDDAAAPFSEVGSVITGRLLPSSTSPFSANYIKIQGYSSLDTITQYKLYVILKEGYPENEIDSPPNDTFAAAQPSRFGDNYWVGRVASIDDMDVYSIDLEANREYFFGLDADPLRANSYETVNPFNAALEILDASGNLVVAVDDAQTTSDNRGGEATLDSSVPYSPGEALIFKPPMPGRYYARVKGTSNTIGEYMLAVDDLYRLRDDSFGCACGGWNDAVAAPDACTAGWPAYTSYLMPCSFNADGSADGWSNEDLTGPPHPPERNAAPVSFSRYAVLPDGSTISVPPLHALSVSCSTSSSDEPRIQGWKSPNIPYTTATGNLVYRFKAHVCRHGQSDWQDQTQIPNMRLRMAVRFSINSMLEAFFHLVSDPTTTDYMAGRTYDGSGLKNTPPPVYSNVADFQTAVYRVDLDPVDVPAMYGENVYAGFECYALEPQENGSLDLVEAQMMTYPAFEDSEGLLMETYQPSASDAGRFKNAQWKTETMSFNPFNGNRSDLEPKPIYLEGRDGVTLDSRDILGVVGYWCTATDPDTFREATVLGLLGVNFDRHPDETKRARASVGKLYRVKYHIMSQSNANKNAQVRLRARCLKFMWSQKLEIGGAFPAGGPGSKIQAIAQQALPGVGTQNPDKLGGLPDIPGFLEGGNYIMYFHPPNGLPPTPGFGEAGDTAYLRDIRVGIDLTDTYSAGYGPDLTLDTGAYAEEGHVLLDRVEIREFDDVLD